MAKIAHLLITILGIFVPLMLSALVPNGVQRWAAALFALIGLFILFNVMGSPESTPFAIGLSIGAMLATAKLATGLRFL